MRTRGGRSGPAVCAVGDVQNHSAGSADGNRPGLKEQLYISQRRARLPAETLQTLLVTLAWPIHLSFSDQPKTFADSNATYEFIFQVRFFNLQFLIPQLSCEFQTFPTFTTAGRPYS